MASGNGALPERINRSSSDETEKVAMITGITGQVGIYDRRREENKSEKADRNLIAVIALLIKIAFFFARLLGYA